MGDKIGYVIVAGPGRLYEKAKPYVLASYDEVDLEYYVSNQVVGCVPNSINGWRNQRGVVTFKNA